MPDCLGPLAALREQALLRERRDGRRLVDVGNLVGPAINQNLAVLVDLDPMRVVFQPAGTELPDYLAAWPSTKVGVKVTVEGIRTTMTFEGDVDLAPLVPTAWMQSLLRGLS